MKLKTIRRGYQREAFVTIVLAQIVVRFVPSARIFSWVNRPPRRINRFAGDQIGWVLWERRREALVERSLFAPRAGNTRHVA